VLFLSVQSEIKTLCKASITELSAGMKSC